MGLFRSGQAIAQVSGGWTRLWLEIGLNFERSEKLAQSRELHFGEQDRSEG